METLSHVGRDGTPLSYEWKTCLAGGSVTIGSVLGDDSEEYDIHSRGCTTNVPAQDNSSWSCCSVLRVVSTEWGRGNIYRNEDSVFLLRAARLQRWWYWKYANQSGINLGWGVLHLPYGRGLTNVCVVFRLRGFGVLNRRFCLAVRRMVRRGTFSPPNGFSRWVTGVYLSEQSQCWPLWNRNDFYTLNLVYKLFQEN